MRGCQGSRRWCRAPDPGGETAAEPLTKDKGSVVAILPGLRCLLDFELAKQLEACYTCELKVLEKSVWCGLQEMATYLADNVCEGAEIDKVICRIVGIIGA